MAENRKRSIVRSIIWRIMGIIILAVITYMYTKQLIQTGLITVLHHGIFLIVFYLHERLHLKYNKIKDTMIKSLIKMFTYETLCGNIILGTITYCITGSWKQMTVITITYIGIKHIIYVWNEFLWKKIKWGTK